MCQIWPVVVWISTLWLYNYLNGIKIFVWLHFYCSFFILLVKSVHCTDKINCCNLGKSPLEEQTCESGDHSLKKLSSKITARIFSSKHQLEFTDRFLVLWPGDVYTKVSVYGRIIIAFYCIRCTCFWFYFQISGFWINSWFVKTLFDCLNVYFPLCQTLL